MILFPASLCLLAQEFVLNGSAVSGGSESNRRSARRRNDIAQLTELQRCGREENCMFCESEDSGASTRSQHSDVPEMPSNCTFYWKILA